MRRRRRAGTCACRAGAKLPAFAAPDEALGDDLFDAPARQAPEGRRWRALLSEAQVVLHNHPLNAQRVAAGLAPVNSLWFWGAGALPDHVRTPLRPRRQRRRDPGRAGGAGQSAASARGRRRWRARWRPTRCSTCATRAIWRCSSATGSRRCWRPCAAASSTTLRFDFADGARLRLRAQPALALLAPAAASFVDAA